MSWAVTELTPLASFLGGMLIGVASLVLLFLNGRIAGISGVLGGALGGDGWTSAWRWCFLAGLPAGAVLVQLLGRPVELTVTTAPWALILGGLLVGVGTRVGSGCTSGHGVCGLARLSRRSVAATAIFMATAVVTVTVIRHVLEWAP